MTFLRSAPTQFIQVCFVFGLTTCNKKGVKVKVRMETGGADVCTNGHENSPDEEVHKFIRSFVEISERMYSLKAYVWKMSQIS